MANPGGSFHPTIHEIEHAEVAQYRWRPNYTDTKVGLPPLFQPTGGDLVFQLRKPHDNLRRQVKGDDFPDILTLQEVCDILSNNPYSEAASIYSHMLTDKVTGQISPIKIATHLRPFGVTSISNVKHWTRDTKVSHQPVLIEGFCNIDKTDYAKQDCLKLPVSMVEIEDGNRSENGRAFLHMTLTDTNNNSGGGGGGWRLKFVVSPKHTYINEEMMQNHTFCLTLPIGIIDYLNHGISDTSIYMFRSASDSHEVESKWFIEGFVFNPLNQWRLHYNMGPMEFYNQFQDYLQLQLLALDPLRKAIVVYFMKAAAAPEDEDDESSSSSDSDDNTGDGGNRKRQLASSGRPSNTKKMRGVGGAGGRRDGRPTKFFGGGRLGGAQLRNIGANLGPAPSGEGEGPSTPGLISDIPQFTPISFSRAFDSTTYGNQQPTAVLNFSLDNQSPPRTVPSVLSTKVFGSFKMAGVNFMQKLNTYLNQNMRGKIYTLPVLDKDTSVSVRSKTIFHILAMSFVGRLKITGNSQQEVSRANAQMSMDRLFSQRREEKIKCLVNYFNKCMVDGASVFANRRQVTFTHKTDTVPNGKNNPINPPHAIRASGVPIEDVPRSVMADFANAFIGGGVYGKGTVQEEIQMLIFPETQLSRALCPKMSDDSSISIMGAMRFNKYTGYSTSFTFAGPYLMPQNPALDQKDRALSEIVAFDALNFSKSRPVGSQYSDPELSREFVKASVAFHSLPNTDPNVPITSGPWGAGAFKGDIVLKALIQVAAASAESRPLILVKLGRRASKAVSSIVNKAIELGHTVAEFLTEIETALANENPNGDDGKTAQIISAHFNGLIKAGGGLSPAMSTSTLYGGGGPESDDGGDMGAPDVPLGGDNTTEFSAVMGSIFSGMAGAGDDDASMQQPAAPAADTKPSKKKRARKAPPTSSDLQPSGDLSALDIVV